MQMGNLLVRAMRLCGSVPVALFAFTGRATNALGYDVSSYAEPVTINAQVQPVTHSAMVFLGLDANKEYVMIYAPALIADISRDHSGDQISWNGATYQIMSNTDWQAINGWQGSLAVKVSTP